MKTRKRPERDPILLEIAAAIGAGRIRVGGIEDERELVHGFARPDGSIVIDPSIDVTDTLLHECLHRLRPTWTERAVRIKTCRLMRQLSRKEIDTLYGLLAVAVTKPRRRPRKAR